MREVRQEPEASLVELSAAEGRASLEAAVREEEGAAAAAAATLEWAAALAAVEPAAARPSKRRLRP